MSDLAKKQEQELREMVAEKKKAIQELDFSLGKSKPGSTTRQGLRREIARIQTELQSRSSKDS
jgi:ribosomal protein L29